MQKASSLQNTSQDIASTGTITHKPIWEVGVNYLSTFHRYSSSYTTDAILNRDFSKFSQDGIKIISISLYWYRIEGNVRGNYDDSFLNEVKRVITDANQYGLKVLVTFHTLWGPTDSPWCTPDYIIDPVSGNNTSLAVVRSDDMRQAFIDMVNHTVSYLSGTPGIWAWALLNEPWYSGRTWGEHDFITDNGKTQKENFITLIQELSTIVKNVDGRPVTVRFCCTSTQSRADGTEYIKNIFDEDWGGDQRIFDSLDFISFNSYIPDDSLQERWRDMTAQNIVGSANRNKQVWITEFGWFKTDNEVEQANAFETMLTFFGSLPVSECLAWQWTAGNIADENSKYASNLCANITTGEGKLAYEKLIEYG
jgi:hypothetical protein